MSLVTRRWCTAGSTEGADHRSGSLKSRSSSLKGHGSGSHKLERKVSFADGSTPGQALDEKPAKLEGSAEKALSQEIPEEQAQAAQAGKVRGAALGSWEEHDLIS
jgi:hypothetical protein